MLATGGAGITSDVTWGSAGAMAILLHLHVGAGEGVCETRLAARA